MCVELETGERKWETFEFSTGSRPANWANVFTVPNGNRFWLFNTLGFNCKNVPKGFELIS